MKRKGGILALAAILTTILVVFQRGLFHSPQTERVLYTQSLPSLSQFSSDQEFDPDVVPLPPQAKTPDHDSSALEDNHFQLPYLPTSNKESRIVHGSDSSVVFPSNYQFKHPLTSIIVDLPTADEKVSLQGRFTGQTQNIERMQAVKTVFTKSFDEYLKYASEYDEIAPLTKKALNSFTGWSITLIDSLDTLLIMNLTNQFEQALTIVEKIDFYTVNGRDDLPVFEMNIRALGGLLSAFEISQKPMLLAKAVELGELLLRAFDTPNHFPVPNLRNYHNGSLPSTTSLLSEVGSLSLEFTKLSMLTNDTRFFSAVSHLYTHLFRPHFTIPGLIPDTIDLSGCDEIMSEGVGVFKSNLFQNSLRVFTEKGVFYCFSSDSLYEIRSAHDEETYSIEGKSDSFYEYLVKMHALLGTPLNTNFTVTALEGISNYVLFEAQIPDTEKLLLAGKVSITEHGGPNIKLTNQASHLSCFAGGLFALSGKLFPAKEEEFSQLAKRLTHGCIALSSKFSGLLPERVSLDRCHNDRCEYNESERVNWIREHTDQQTKSSRKPSPRPNNITIDGRVYDIEEDTEIPYSPLRYLDKNRVRWKTGNVDDQPLWVNSMDPRYLLRPELIESLFTLYRTTGDSYYKDQGWKIFEAISEVAMANGNTYAPIDDVTKTVSHRRQLDVLESFWFAETLKYLYLLYSQEDFFSLDEYVFSTEAHPFKRGG